MSIYARIVHVSPKPRPWMQTYGQLCNAVGPQLRHLGYLKLDTGRNFNKTRLCVWCHDGSEKVLGGADGLQVDNPWRAANYFSTSTDGKTTPPRPTHRDSDHQWKRPTSERNRSMSFSRSLPRSSSARSSPSRDGYPDEREAEDLDEYNSLFSYSSEFLAGMLCPNTSLCHQKFELIVDDLVFLGHPVCVESDGSWSFKPEKAKSSSRGRRNQELIPIDDEKSERSAGTAQEQLPPQMRSAWLQMFHFVIVLDLPDPSSSASGNVAKYFDIIYEQIAFTVTAVLFQEQVLSNFVETECDTLYALKDDCMDKEREYSEFSAQALQVSSIAPAMKLLYEAIKSSTMAYITLHDLPLELQLPPYLDQLLHSEEEYTYDFLDHQIDPDEPTRWGPQFDVGWRLPSLAPWKSLLLLDNEDGLDPYENLRGPHVRPDERALAESLIRFLKTASVTLSLADMATLLDWDLELQIYPTVRWLVLHRRAKVVDTVHRELKTIFTLPPKFEQPLAKLSTQFKIEFPHSFIPPLPALLATISNASSKQTDNHFFAVVVQSKELIPLYHEVVLWMLKRDLLYALHLHIRVIAPSELKIRVRYTHERKMQRLIGMHPRGRSNSRKISAASHGISQYLKEEMSRRVNHQWYSRRLLSSDSRHNNPADLSASLFTEEEEYAIDDDEESDDDNIDWGPSEDCQYPSLISDPATASPLERKWLNAMSEGKPQYIKKRFDLINQYFDGKKADDEILYRAEISRKQLREVLHHYEDYLQTFLHPS
ncbi:hypothetical protein CONPUDRAFT_142545 [Coniophora puteana RWD-64-598 SS2]|uniref:Nitrogen permease regulator 3 n=1 Tax=Coniophora puteana (strain RWD-64-598) TaxID=741705 RepID=A0A5M3MYI4_CONPW|nr:uncharacterized protein CONPUDRAFT_142545 [Coniophora puteana RWD-64-598 SS2]EIW84116.1 hypothetical protein CONPUDRAFT_142545 [Coniophora puteana RWD-64-598 SS2]